MSSLPMRLDAPWLGWTSTRLVVAALTEGGGQCWFVGGCVRDSLLAPGRHDAALDIDLTTDLLPERVAASATAARLKAIPTGIEHGTVTVVAEGRPFEVTTLRRDVATDGRHAVVAFGGSLAEDAGRRDFTINALYARPDGELVDPLGGLADLRARRVRFVGEPERRILEDHLRILRFFRFFARFGGAAPDPSGLAACIRHAALLQSLSAERVAKELLKLLAGQNVLASLQAMADGGILAALAMEDAEAGRLAPLLRLAPDADPLLRLAALFHEPWPVPGRGERLALQLRLSSAESRRLEAALGEAAPPLDEAPADLQRRWYREGGTEAWRDRFLLAAAARGLGPEAVRASLALARAWARPEFPIGGRDALALGMRPGPKVGTLLRAVEAWWLDRDMRPDRQACLAELSARYRLDEPPPDP
ncbi:MAG TPA: CCA tRNA nucleotidyltransferase [Geminicoccus sp.]|uniref:CCA tRNA nucleotidyltransferase n=1 Tax=Geminicoccus sp. TaxID=2024832 RepID=UPI002C169B65|nr:CCA tRNA nucleotidyltransferase [Geminicoccus sp.]HWL70877.1 CCA tRNA nucleotidyltransferase [Geminicoccus sp.]